jgi:hypothetical protein
MVHNAKTKTTFMKNLIIVAVIFLSSCMSTRKLMDSWVGDSKQNLILKWGPPERLASDGGSGEIMIYSRQVYNSYTRQTIYQCKMFYVDLDGEIYHWLAQSSLVPPQQMDVNLYIR